MSKEKRVTARCTEKQAIEFRKKALEMGWASGDALAKGLVLLVNEGKIKAKISPSVELDTD